MAKPRKRPGRDYAAEYKARQARARAQGFSGYYAKRIRGGESASPSTRRPTGARLRAARGHASAADLRRLLESKQAESVTYAPVGRDRASGRFTEIRVSVIGPDGTAQHFDLRGAKLDERELRSLGRAMVAAGADIYSSYASLDRMILGDPDALEEGVAAA